jgi:hypothetical protein
MVALLLSAYAAGLYSSRRIAKACAERTDFIMIVALDGPDFRTVSEFRHRPATSSKTRLLRNAPSSEHCAAAGREPDAIGAE